MSDSDCIVVTLRFFTLYDGEKVAIKVDWGDKRIHSKKIQGSFDPFDYEGTGLKVWLIQTGVVNQEERIRCDLEGIKLKDGSTIHIVLPDRPIPVVV